MDQHHRQLDRCDSYEDQLHGLFLSCCKDEAEGTMDRSALEDLCRKLELPPDQSRVLVRQLLPDPAGSVSFETFKEGLVSFLEKLSSDEQAAMAEEKQKEEEEETENRSAFGRKKYGRRSRPEDEQVEEDEVMASAEAFNEKVSYLPYSCDAYRFSFPWQVLSLRRVYFSATPMLLHSLCFLRPSVSLFAGLGKILSHENRARAGNPLFRNYRA